MTDCLEQPNPSAHVNRRSRSGAKSSQGGGRRGPLRTAIPGVQAQGDCHVGERGLKMKVAVQVAMGEFSFLFLTEASSECPLFELGR